MPPKRAEHVLYCIQHEQRAGHAEYLSDNGSGFVMHNYKQHVHSNIHVCRRQKQHQHSSDDAHRMLMFAALAAHAATA